MSAIRGEENEGTVTATDDPGVAPKGDLVWIAGGEFTMGVRPALSGGAADAAYWSTGSGSTATR